MAITKERKGELLDLYSEQLAQSRGIILANYRGLRVAQIEQLRRQARENDIVFHVATNRLLKLALSRQGLQVPDEWLEGPTAVAFCHGEVPAAAKVLIDLAKEMELFTLKGGLLGATPISVQEVETLAKLPSREVLLAQVLGGINAPASQVVGVIASGIRQVLNVLQAYVDKLEEGATPVPQAA